jgi:hypothetical protein
MARRRVLLGQLGAAGDCVYATTVARQIKHDEPDCHLVWAIGSMYRHVIAHDPHVDEVWEVPLASRAEMPAAWAAFAREARERKARGDLDEVFLTQIDPDNYRNFDGTVRPSIFRGYPRPITVPVTPVIRLGDDEIARVEEFARHHRLHEGGPTVIFECAHASGQSSVTLDWALDVARTVVRRLPNVKLVMSSRVGQAPDEPGIVDGSVLKFRDFAALTHHASLLVGCSSGISWVCTSDAARTLPTLQVLSRTAGNYGAMVHDLDYWGLPSDHAIEMRDSPAERAAACVVDMISSGVAQARATYHEPLVSTFGFYSSVMLRLLREGKIETVLGSVRNVLARYGPRRDLAVEVARQLRDRIARRLPFKRR